MVGRNKTIPDKRSNKMSIWEDIGSWLGIPGVVSTETREERENATTAFERSQQSANSAMAFESAQAEKNRNFQAEMSNSAHTRALADLKNAGLNPVLAANSAASTPTGASASGHSAQAEKAKSGANESVRIMTQAMTSIFNSATKLISTSIIGKERKRR